MKARRDYACQDAEQAQRTADQNKLVSCIQVLSAELGSSSLVPGSGSHA